MSAELTQQVEASLDKPPEELEEELPEILDQLDGQEREFVEENRELFAKVVGRMEEVDVASFVEENPQTASQFQDLLWSGMEVIAENEESVREAIGLDLSVNFEADDCPMEGHLVVDANAETIEGGSGQLDDGELKIIGPADTLVAIITGDIDPVQGFMGGEYEMEGPVPKGTQLAPVMDELSEQLEADQ